jgi:hypothetical protein
LTLSVVDILEIFVVCLACANDNRLGQMNRLCDGSAGDGTRVAHHFQVDHVRVPQGWRMPYCLTTLSGLDIRFRRPILATIACLLLPSSFAELITPTSDFSRQLRGVCWQK